MILRKEQPNRLGVSELWNSSLGRAVRLDDTRVVFVGRIEGVDEVFVGFRNAEGRDTKLRLSPEAFDALVWLHKNTDGYTERFPQSEQGDMVWQVSTMQMVDEKAIVFETQETHKGDPS
jgi:hypothetical protein